MKTNHTPPPWHTDGTNIYRQQNPGGRKSLIAMVSREPIIEQVRANSILLAAAPELLAFVQSIAGCVKFSEAEHPERMDHIPDTIDAQISAARRLVSKATETV